MPAELFFRAMGASCHLLIEGGPEDIARRAKGRVLELEKLWSRFEPESEISRLNEAAGAPCPVTDETVELVRRSLEASALTRGWFDPTVLPAVLAAGYDRDFGDIRQDPAPGPARPGSACIGIVLDDGVVMLPEGVTLDPGGIGKGLAADIVARESLAAGARSILINVGGDLRAAGDPPHPEGWPISITHPANPAREVDRIALQAGAVATSSSRLRRWRRGHQEMHHVIDPRTGRPAAKPPAGVTVFAASGWWAEAAATALVAGAKALPDIDAWITTGLGVERIRLAAAR